jgi:hypothetical protein
MLHFLPLRIDNLVDFQPIVHYFGGVNNALEQFLNASVAGAQGYDGGVRAVNADGIEPFDERSECEIKLGSAVSEPSAVTDALLWIEEKKAKKTKHFSD